MKDNKNNNIMWKFKISKRHNIIIINVNNYIGDSTSLKIEYATKLRKEIIYYTDLIKRGKVKRIC